jgi:GNAT superfamily N-acetyltransferase
VIRDYGISAVRLDAIRTLRDEYRREMNCQIVHDSWHERGFTTSHVFTLSDQAVGYGSVGASDGGPKTTVKEFFVRPQYREDALSIFRRFVAASGATSISAQTNDLLLSAMLQSCAVDVSSDTILFADAGLTHLDPRGVKLQKVRLLDRLRVFRHTIEPVGDWGLVLDSRVVATGGLLFHYNPPYGDIYMEVSEPFRRRGYGSYLVQELKRICREGGHVPAARCNQENEASQRTLERAGMVPCGAIVTGRLRLDDTPAALR